MVKIKTRTLKELYTILLESYITNVKNGVKIVDIVPPKNKVFNYYSYYICNHITNLHDNNIITSVEKKHLLMNFQSNRPTKILHNDFYQNPNFYKRNDNYAWWKYKNWSPVGIEVRIKFINHLISIHSTE